MINKHETTLITSEIMLKSIRKFPDEILVGFRKPKNGETAYALYQQDGLNIWIHPDLNSYDSMDFELNLTEYGSDLPDRVVKVLWR